jgi:cytochrome c553
MALHEYKDGRRGNAIMKGFAATLSDGDIDDVAAYFSSLPGKVTDLHGHIQGD